jgi:hypothetical protein
MRGFRSFLILFGVAAALFGYIYFVELERDPAGTAEKKDKVFAIEPGKIEELEIRSASGDVTSLKKQGEQWQIVAPEAVDVDESEVSSIVTALESLEVQRTLEENPASVAAFGLEPPRFSVGFRVAGDTAMRRLLAGRKTPTGGDLYARVEGQPKLFLVSAYQEDSLNKTTFALREKSVLKIARDGIDALTLEAPGTPAVVLSRKGSDWRLTKPTDARADFSAIDGIVNRVTQARMKAIVAPAPSAADLKKYGLDKPQALATIGAGSTRAVLAIGAKQDDTSVYARDLSRPMVFTVDTALLDELKRTPGDLRNKELFQFRSFTALGLDVSLGRTALTFAKEKPASADQASAPEVWKQTKPDAKDVDQGKLTDLISTLSNLRADTFADKALATGEDLTVTARFGDAATPQTEKVTFRRSGKVVHAILAGEPGGAVIPTAEFDKALALFKEIAGIK